MSKHLVKDVSVARSNTVVIITAQCLTATAAETMYKTLAREARSGDAEMTLLVGDAAEAFRAAEAAQATS